MKSILILSFISILLTTTAKDPFYDEFYKDYLAKYYNPQTSPIISSFLRNIKSSVNVISNMINIGIPKEIVTSFEQSSPNFSIKPSFDLKFDFEKNSLVFKKGLGGSIEKDNMVQYSYIEFVLEGDLILQFTKYISNKCNIFLFYFQ